MKINNMKNIIVVFFSLVAAPAQAGDLYLDVNGYSWHSSDTYTYKGVHEYNTNNAGLGMTYSANKYLEASAGFYENSYYTRSLYGGAKIKYDINISKVNVAPAISVCIATGYVDTPDHANYLQVFMMPAVRLAYRGVGFTIGYVPRIEKENTMSVSAITLQFNFRVWRF